MTADIIARRFTAVSGLLAAVLYVIFAALLARAPLIGESDEDTAAFFTSSSNRSIILTALYLFGLCVGCTWSFLAGLWSVLRRVEGVAGLFSTLGLLAGMACFTLALGGMVFLAVLGYRGSGDGAASLLPRDVRLLADLTTMVVGLSGFPTAVSCGAFSASLLTVPRVIRHAHPIAYYGLLVAVAHLVSGGAFASPGLFMLSPSGIGVFVCPFLYYAWMIWISVAVLLKGEVVKADPLLGAGPNTP